jgi:ArsR family transcriptional regulator, arsenate/arsenite/antimonite-responsive transcriptional repressor
MHSVGLAILILGWVLGLLGTLWVIVLAWQRSVLWGLVCLLVPIVQLVYIVAHWKEAKEGFFPADIWFYVGDYCHADGRFGTLDYERHASIFGLLDILPYFCNYRNMATTVQKKNAEQVARFADMFSAMGTEARLRIMQLLLSAHPEGMVVGELQTELEIPNSTLSHHLDKLKNEGLVLVSRESTFLRYTANTEALQEVLQFLYAECCTRNKAVAPRDVIQICK